MLGAPSLKSLIEKQIRANQFFQLSEVLPAVCDNRLPLIMVEEVLDSVSFAIAACHYIDQMEGEGEEMRRNQCLRLARTMALKFRAESGYRFCQDKDRAIYIGKESEEKLPFALLRPMFETKFANRCIHCLGYIMHMAETRGITARSPAGHMGDAETMGKCRGFEKSIDASIFNHDPYDNMMRTCLFNDVYKDVGWWVARFLHLRMCNMCWPNYMGIVINSQCGEYSGYLFRALSNKHHRKLLDDIIMHVDKTMVELPHIVGESGQLEPVDDTHSPQERRLGTCNMTAFRTMERYHDILYREFKDRHLSGKMCRMHGVLFTYFRSHKAIIIKRSLLIRLYTEFVRDRFIGIGKQYEAIVDEEERSAKRQRVQ
jgi:hypothetical protein